MVIRTEFSRKIVTYHVSDTMRVVAVRNYKRKLRRAAKKYGVSVDMEIANRTGANVMYKEMPILVDSEENCLQWAIENAHRYT